MIHLVACGTNYIHLFQGQTGEWIVVDPTEAKPVREFLKARRGTLDWILNTHHHPDHVGGNLELQEATGAQVICSAYDFHRVPGANQSAATHFELGGLKCETVSIPGHTLGHVAFYLPQWNSAFVGDTLFSMGCGRLYEGTAEQLLHSLKHLCRWPETTQLYCGHEYTETNLRFALSLRPAAHDLQEELERVRGRGDRPSLPTRVEHEKRLNPFLRANSPEWQNAVGMKGASELEVFTELRRRKDTFQ